MAAAFDHFAVAADSLAEGAAWAEAALGLPLAGGGEHALMGTHNRLLSLGAGEYMEVIAVNPAAPPPGRPRWFDLDRFAGAPRITNWILRCDDLDAALALAPPGTGTPVDFQRGALRWRMAVPDDGILPFGGAFPALIEWQGDRHATEVLPPSGCTLAALEIAHPEAADLSAVLAPLLTDARVRILPGPEKAIRATLDTPAGPRVLA